MRDLNRFAKLESTPIEFVLILPMRDWNISRLLLNLFTYIFVLILPMRDWNTCQPYQRRLFLLCFDLTYEGLKFKAIGYLQKFLFTFWSYLWGIEICFSKSLSAMKSSFDLTYEGLKLTFQFFNFTRASAVLILPMRDWNREWYAKPKRKQSRFDLTYEGLKQDVSCCGCNRYNRFDLTYEGLKLYQC